jgi:DNA segregation ATPase FtsK/SpoIIIE, S-DNA-T family
MTAEPVLVSPEEFARTFNARHAIALRARVVGSDARTVARVTKLAVTHEATRTVAREVAYIPGGLVAVARWAWENCTGAGLAQDVKDARARGDYDNLMRLRELQTVERHQRFERIMGYLMAPQKILKGLVVVVLMLVGGLLGLGVAAALALGDPSLITGPIRAVFWAGAWLVWVFTVGGTAIVVGGCGLVVLALWAIGRRAGDVPEFLAPEREKANQPGDVITRSLAVQAFRDLGITALRQAIDKMEDGGNSLIVSTGIVRSGCGVEFDFALPSGVDVEEVIGANRLAGNLLRHKSEVFPTIAKAARTVNVWAANSGALNEPIGASPLVYDESIRADYKRGVAPWGESMRGDPFGISLYQCHLLVTGLSKMGKTSALRALALWLVTDTKPRLRIADLKGFGDWSMFSELAETYIEGCAKADIIAATEMLEEAVEEMKHRLQNRIVDPPLIVLVDEAQLAFASDVTDPAGIPYGGAKNRSRFYQACLEILNQGRAVNVMLWLGTQDPTNQNLPERVREAMHIRCSLALGNAKKTRMALGEKAADTGAAPHNLRYGIDRGTVVVSGDGVDFEQGQAFATVRTHFIGEKDATAIAERALKLRGPVQHDPDEVRDLVQDVHEAMGPHAKMKATDVVSLLREMAPRYRKYQPLNGIQLGEWLGREGVVVRDDKGVLTVRADRVLQELDRRQGVE